MGYGSYTPLRGFDTNLNNITSYPESVNSPQTDWGLQLSQLLASLGQNQYNWARDEYNKGMKITDQRIKDFMKLSGYGQGLAKNLMGRYTDVFQPIMDKYIQQAGTYNSEARQRFNMGRAESTTAQADKAAMDSAERSLQSFGINPNSGRYQDLILSGRIKDAAARAGAGTKASMDTAAAGREMTYNAAKLGQNVPGMTVNALNSAYTGVQGAQNALTSMMNTGANLANTASNLFGNAGSANKVPPTGQVHQQPVGTGGGGGGSGAKPSQEGKGGGGSGKPGGGKGMWDEPLGKPDPLANRQGSGGNIQSGKKGGGKKPQDKDKDEDKETGAGPGQDYPSPFDVPTIDVNDINPTDVGTIPQEDIGKGTPLDINDYNGDSVSRLPPEGPIPPAEYPVDRMPYEGRYDDQGYPVPPPGGQFAPGFGPQPDNEIPAQLDQKGAENIQQRMDPERQAPEWLKDVGQNLPESTGARGQDPYDSNNFADWLATQGFNPQQPYTDPGNNRMGFFDDQSGFSGSGTPSDNYDRWNQLPSSDSVIDAQNWNKDDWAAFQATNPVNSMWRNAENEGPWSNPAWNPPQEPGVNDFNPNDYGGVGQYGQTAYDDQQGQQFGEWDNQDYQDYGDQQDWGGDQQYDDWGGQQNYQDWGGDQQYDDWGGQQQDWGGDQQYNNWSGQQQDYQDYGGSGQQDFSGGDWEDWEYARGGPVQRPRRPRGGTTGGPVPKGASPSRGRVTDDVPARLNADEFVIPRDVKLHKGTEFFQKLIAASRKARGASGPPPKPKMKPALRLKPTFVSRPM